VADNLGVTPGSGATVRAKDHGGTLVQYVYVTTALPTVLTGQQTLSVGTASDSSLTVPSGATHALATVDSGGGDVRYWENGTSPSTSAGLLIPAGAAAELVNLSQVRMRSTTGTVGVNVSYRRYDQ
jgi:hypothetical protein